jgi:hypothetical protein
MLLFYIALGTWEEVGSFVFGLHLELANFIKAQKSVVPIVKKS